MSALSVRAGGLLTRSWDAVIEWLTGQGRHASHGLAAMRIGFGGMTLVILAIYLPEFSYFFGKGAAWGEALYRTSSVHDFVWPISHIFARSDPEWLMITKMFVLALLAGAFSLGWHTRVVGPLFAIFWLGFAALNPVVLNTGHYQTFRVLLLFLLLTDSAACWSLDSRRRRRKSRRAPGRRFVVPWIPVLSNNIGVVLIAYQLCTIYVTSALWKLEGRTWRSGVAVYYPLQLEELTVLPWLSDLLSRFTPFVYTATWLSVFVQLLFPLMLLTTWTRRVGLVLITAMHLGIGVLLAIPWFSITMVLADMIFIRERTWRVLGDRVRGVLARARRKRQDAPTEGDSRTPGSRPAPRRGHRSVVSAGSPDLGG